MISVCAICPCGEVAVMSPSEIGRKQFCSRECRNKYLNARVPHEFKEAHKDWYKKGNKPWNTGKPLSEEQRKIQSDKLKGKRLSIRTEFKKGQRPWNQGKEFNVIKGEKHVNWAGDEVGYNALHTWITNNYGSPSKCEDCKTEESKRFMWHNISGEYKRTKKDWKRLCAKCHAHIHKNWEKRRY